MKVSFDAFYPRSLICEVQGEGAVSVALTSPQLGSFERRHHARGLCRGTVHFPLVAGPVPAVTAVHFAHYSGTVVELSPNVVGVKLFGDLYPLEVPS